jgi:RNA polymerase sigma-70 factor (ECF subfamily)
MSNPELLFLDYGRLYEENYGRLVKFSVWYTRDTAAAEDIVSDSILKLLTSPAPNSNPTAYVFSIVRNNCLQWLLDKKRHLEVEKSVFLAQKYVVEENIKALEHLDMDRLFSHEIVAIVEKALETMPELACRVFVNHRYHGMSYDRIAAESNISNAKVDAEMRKALKILRVALKDYLCCLLLILNHT